MWNITSKCNQLLKSTPAIYNDLFYTKADPRTRDRFLMGNPALIITIYILYVIIIKVVLPKFMKNRPPYRLKTFENWLILILFGSSLYILIVACKFWFFHYNWRCEAIDQSESPLAMLHLATNTLATPLEDDAIKIVMVDTAYLYLLSKFFYIFESVVLSLRKNYSYLETYLLIHHFMYPIGVWCVVNYYPSGHATFLGLVNPFAHSVMFGYHLIANNFGLKLKLYRYKSTVNLVMLLVQMILFFPHFLQLFFKNDCNFPMEYPIFVSIFVSTAFLLMGLFVVPQAVKFHKDDLKNINKLQMKNVNSMISFDLEKL